MSRLLRRSRTGCPALLGYVLLGLLLALVLAGCGGGGSRLSAGDVEKKLANRINEKVSCTETTAQGRKLQTFTCTDEKPGETVLVAEGKDRSLVATIFDDQGKLVDFVALR